MRRPHFRQAFIVFKADSAPVQDRNRITPGLPYGRAALRGKSGSGADLLPCRSLTHKRHWAA